jgi:hypothetical protein
MTPGDEIIITHGTHPYRGQRVRIAARQGRKQKINQVWIELPNGEQHLIPLSWTDREAGKNYPGGERFLIETLLQLQEMVDRKAAESNVKGKMVVEQKGDDHEPRIDRSTLGADDGRDTPASDRCAGANVAALAGSQDGGSEQ